MTDIIHLPDNIIGKDDKQALEIFAGHTIALGRATRFHWNEGERGDAVFEIYRGGADEVLSVRISRDREHDVFRARDDKGNTLVMGTLDHVLARLEAYFTDLHDELPPSPA